MRPERLRALGRLILRDGRPLQVEAVEDGTVGLYGFEGEASVRDADDRGVVGGRGGGRPRVAADPVEVLAATPGHDIRVVIKVQGALVGVVVAEEDYVYAVAGEDGLKVSPYSIDAAVPRGDVDRTVLE